MGQVKDRSSNLSYGGKLLDGRKGDRNEGNDDDNSLLAMGTLKVDSRSRITLTKELKDILSVRADDTIAIYQDKDNGDIIIKVQRGSEVVDTLKITKDRAPIESKKTKFQKDPLCSHDKINELTAPYYYLDDPKRKYFPNIVLIDDDPDVLFTYQSYLSEEGFNVRIFSKPDEALNYLISRSYENTVVITDIRMPGVTGLEVYQALKSANKNIQIIFVSALDATNELLSIFPDVKKSNIIRKPVNRDRFVQNVKDAIFG